MSGHTDWKTVKAKMEYRQKPNWEKDYGEIWADFRDNPHYKGLHPSELRKIHLFWKRIAAEVR